MYNSAAIVMIPDLPGTVIYPGGSETPHHLTLVYFDMEEHGDISQPELDRIRTALRVRSYLSEESEAKARVAGYGVLGDEDTPVMLVDSELATKLHHRLLLGFEQTDLTRFNYRRSLIPHISYSGGDRKARYVGDEIEFIGLALWHRDERELFRFVKP